MEEFVGGLWHRLVTRTAQRDHRQAAATMESNRGTLGLLFRAFGGDSGLRVTAAPPANAGGPRGLLARIAGTDRRAASASLDEATLQLPASLAIFSDPALNRDHYIWLAMLAAHHHASDRDDWFGANRTATIRALTAFPGFVARYRRLVETWIASTAEPLKDARMQAVACVMREPGAITISPMTTRPDDLPATPLWLAPASRRAPVMRTAAPAGAQRSEARTSAERQRLQARRVADQSDKHGFLLPFRAESLLTWSEYVRVSRRADDDADTDASRTAHDLDHLSMAVGDSNTVARVRFDLDLPSASEDDAAIGPGIRLPEWDWRRSTMLPNHCLVQPLIARRAPPLPLPERLVPLARRLKRQLEALRPQRRWQSGSPDGPEIDLDRYVRAIAERSAGNVAGMDRCHREPVPARRDLACLLLADLSLSTDAWISDDARVIDVIQDTLMLFGEAVSITGDQFAMYGFSSKLRGHVRYHRIKAFSERFTDATRGRIARLKPGFYTRMGAAIRQSTALLGDTAARSRLLLLVTDGKPNDLDLYEGRYGLEDTRMAVCEARRAGVVPFCVTIDHEAGDYLPHVFGRGGYSVIHDARALPEVLPPLYSRLTSAR